MGLDMYLEKCSKGANPRKSDTQEIAYWRKSNQVRQWIVSHTNYPADADCEYHKLTSENIISLRDDCIKVLEDHSLAEELLPTQSGFFFGDTGYNEYYFSDLEDTVAQLSDVLATTDFETEDVYYYEWW